MTVCNSKYIWGRRGLADKAFLWRNYTLLFVLHMLWFGMTVSRSNQKKKCSISKKPKIQPTWEGVYWNKIQLSRVILKQLHVQSCNIGLHFPSGCLKLNLHIVTKLFTKPMLTLSTNTVSSFKLHHDIRVTTHVTLSNDLRGTLSVLFGLH